MTTIVSAVGARSAIGVVAETVWGTTPTTPALLELPFTGFKMEKSLDKYQDPSIQGDRMYRPSVTGNTKVAGDLDVSYSPLNFDALIASLFNNVWSTNTLTVGNTQASFTFEHALLDINQYFQYTGVIVDKLALKISTTGIITATFSLIGKDSPTPTTASIDVTVGTAPNGFYTAPQTALPFTHNGGTFKEGGATIATLMSLDLTIENKNATNFALGNSTAYSLTPGMIEVTGTASVFMQDASLYNKFVNSTSSSLDFTFTNGTNTHEWIIPNLRYHGASKPVSGVGPITLSLPFVGFYDSTTATNVKLVRT